MRIRIHRAAGAFCTAFALAFLCAGGAQAQEVFDTAADINDDKDLDASAFLVNQGTTAFVDVQKTCVEGEDSVTISSFSDHPDKTKASNPSAGVEQGQKGNEPTIVVSGEGALEFEVALVCEKAEVSGDADLKKSKGKFDLKGKNCAGLDIEEVVFVQDVCRNAKNTKIKSKEDVLQKVQVKGKGIATEANG